MRLLHLPPALLAALSVSPAFSQLTLDTTSPDSIDTDIKAIAENMVNIYTSFLNTPGVGVPGELPQPYYWWEAGAMLGSLIDYWYYTGDTQYNDLVTTGLQFQIGPDNDYMPPNQTKDEGNDDQVFWGFSCMSAAEYKFPNPPDDKPQWLALAQGVWNSQQLRWNAKTCGGGLNWQIFTFNNGYDYKNSPSSAGFLNLGARLYAYTGNETFSDWTEKTWTWMSDIGLIGGDKGYSVFDGTSENNNCTTIDHIQWSYSFGMLINAAAVMWNATGDDMWKTRAQGVWDASSVFFNSDKTLYEVACEGSNNCDTDQLSFKAYFARFVAASTKWAPWLYDTVQPFLLATAEAAAKSCNSGGAAGATCGTKWTTGSYDGSTGVGQQMSALEALGSLLVQQSAPPVTEKSGGTSHGDNSAGTTGDTSSTTGQPPMREITAGDKAGAGILTALIIVGMLGGTWWMVS